MSEDPREAMLRLVEEARRRAELLGVNEPPVHWQQRAEDRADPAAEPLPVQLEARELVSQANHCAAIRALLAHGAWHSSLELARVGGLRFGGRLFEIRRGADGGRPVDVESKRAAVPGGRRVAWFYRLAR